MLAEMLRLTRRGGRVGVIVRASDQPRFLNLSLPPELEATILARSAQRAESHAVDVVTSACTGDSSMPVWWTSRWAPTGTGHRGEVHPVGTRLVDQTVPSPSAAEVHEFRAGVARAEQDRTLIFAQPTIVPLARACNSIAKVGCRCICTVDSRQTYGSNRKHKTEM